MTKLTYIFTAPDGNKVEVNNYPQAVALQERYGGSFVAKYTPIRDNDKIETDAEKKVRLERIAKRQAAIRNHK